ncbi:MAG: dTDP-4-amino-4,6-dideoxygalactose transaminase [Cyclobacteriaceae bacterium]
MNGGIDFNKPYITGKEANYIADVIATHKLAGNGKYTKFCQQAFQDFYGFQKCLLTTSCTDALEMAALLLDIRPGDEVIIPSYSFVSTANAFLLRGATIVFADSMKEEPNLDCSGLEQLITPKTKVIVPVHYAGVACDMDAIMDLSYKYNIYVVEDAAQAIDSYYIGRDGERKPLGSIGHLAAFSFHETKNIISGEGGMLVVNDLNFAQKAEIIWEKGTNRSAFFRGEIDRYGWEEIGSSYMPSELIAAFLKAQLEHLVEIQNGRIELWRQYFDLLKERNVHYSLPFIPNYATNNAHMFYLICENSEARDSFIKKLSALKITATSHFRSLHRSRYFENKYNGFPLVNADRFTDCLIRLPLYYELQGLDISSICKVITN